MGEVRVRLIGFDSMGSRGMATVIEYGGVKLFIDPGVSYAPRRYGLPPHPLEEERLRRHLEEIYREVGDATHIVISHYHRDHYLYRDGEEEYYRGKVVLAKHSSRMINRSQAIRAYVLFKKMGVAEKARELRFIDGERIRVDSGVELVFSRPVPHGEPGTKLGYVIMTLVDLGGYRVLHASDVQGPVDEEALRFIIDAAPNLLVISGPPTYFAGFKVRRSVVERGLRNLERIVAETPGLEVLVADHHLLRDLGYRERLSNVYRAAEERGVRVLTAAEYMGRPVEQLEALRKKLWSLSGDIVEDEEYDQPGGVEGD